MRVLVRTCGGSEVATLDAELSWRKEDVLAVLPARTHDLTCEERVLLAGKKLPAPTSTATFAGEPHGVGNVGDRGMLFTVRATSGAR